MKKFLGWLLFFVIVIFLVALAWATAAFGGDRSNNNDCDDEIMDAKPVIYLYPEEDTVCSVTLELNGKFTCTYPAYGEDGWRNFVASPDGTLTFPDGKQYYCLYWEGVTDKSLDLSCVLNWSTTR